MHTCFVVGLLLASAAALAGFQGTPRCSAVDPDTVKSGDTVNATCTGVGEAAGAELYLTDGKDDTKVAVMEKSADKIKFQVPRIKAGRYHLAFMTANKASIIEQPVVLTVE
jgi:hypothetical protein